MIVGNYTSHTKSDFCEIVNVITNFHGQPLSVECDVWLGLVVEWLEQRKVLTVLIKLPEAQQCLCTNFLLCLLLRTLLTDNEVVCQKFTTELHIY